MDLTHLEDHQMYLKLRCQAEGGPGFSSSLQCLWCFAQLLVLLGASCTPRHPDTPLEMQTRAEYVGLDLSLQQSQEVCRLRAELEITPVPNPNFFILLEAPWADLGWSSAGNPGAHQEVNKSTLREGGKIEW